MPITLIVLTYLRKLFSVSSQQLAVSSRQIEPETDEPQEKVLPFTFYLLPFAIGVLAGTLPLIHLHSLIVLFIVSAFLFFFSLDKYREWIAFGVGVCVIAIPELVFAMSGTSNRTSEFFGWHFGWDKGNENVILFYIKSLGFFIPILIASLIFTKQRNLTNDSQLTTQQLYFLPAVFTVLFYRQYL